MTAIRTFSLLVALLIAGPAWAGEAMDRLNDFTDNLRSFSAEFDQTRYDEEQEPIRESSGMAYLQRPGKFRWTYEEPFEQVIVADGERLWIYDADLEQVTVREAEQALATAPIMLLSGEAPLDEQFDMRDLGEREGLHWVELQPQVTDSDFDQIFLGLDDDGLRVMELRDRFDQATQIRFSDVRMNPELDPERFTFEPPEGVDVIGRQE
ncbi:MAG: outer membrane lipoprotein chaperone LolA [Halofilum sp. (in: g-proteobacteria)]